MSITTAATVSSSKAGEEGADDSDLDEFLVESPTATGSSRRHRVTSSARVGSIHSGYSDSGVETISSPGSTATHSLARSSITMTSKASRHRPVIRDMYSEYSLPSPRMRSSREGRAPGSHVISSASIDLQQQQQSRVPVTPTRGRTATLDASISTDDFYFPLEASVLLPAQSTPLYISRATLPHPESQTTTTTRRPYESSSLDRTTQTSPPKAKKAKTRRFFSFPKAAKKTDGGDEDDDDRSAERVTREQKQPHSSAHSHTARTDQLYAEASTPVLSTPSPAGVILVKPAASSGGTASVAVLEEKNTAAASLRIPAMEEAERRGRHRDSSADSEDSMEASWYQPHRISPQVKLVSKKTRRKGHEQEEEEIGKSLCLEFHAFLLLLCNPRGVVL